MTASVMTLIKPGTSKYIKACETATEILGIKVRYLAQYSHGAHSVGLVLKRGNRIEIPIRPTGPGTTGGYLQGTEHMLNAALREWQEEEMPAGVPLTTEDLVRYGSFVGMHDTTGHTVASQTDLREWGVFLLLDLPDSVPITFTPTTEALSKMTVSYEEILTMEDQFRPQEYKLLRRAAAAAAGRVTLPKLTTDPEGEGHYLCILNGGNVAF
jgi:hypothetical protein